MKRKIKSETKTKKLAVYRKVDNDNVSIHDSYVFNQKTAELLDGWTSLFWFLVFSTNLIGVYW